MPCKLCRHERINEIESLVRASKLTMPDAARELSCTYQEVWKHFNNCLKAPGNEEEFEKYLKILRELVDRLNTRVEDIEGTPTNLITVRMLTSLTKEMRGVIRDLGALEGRLQTGTLIQLTNVTIKYEKLTNILFSSLCDKCRGNLITELEAMEPINLEAMR